MDQMEQKRRRDFLAALTDCGNLSLAAERAMVSRSWAMNRRRHDPVFREQTDAAMAAAHRRLRASTGSGPERQWRAQDGHELVIQHGRRTFVQVRRAGRKQWTPRTEARFLRALAQTCNVTAAVREVGTTFASAYRHRRRWPDFADRWNAALEEGYDRLSTLIVANAGRMLGVEEMIPEVPMPDVTFSKALETLQLYRRQLHGDGRQGRRRGQSAKPLTLDDVRETIMRRLECIVRADEEEVARIEAAAEEW